MRGEGAAELKILKDYALVREEPQDARWGLVQMCRVGGGLEKIERSTRQDLRILRGGQPLPQTSKGRLLLAKYG